MNRSTDIIKDIVTEEGHNIKLWRETQYKAGGLETNFFVDVKEQGHLIMREPYQTLNDALDKYYSLIGSALKYGQSLHRVRL